MFDIVNKYLMAHGLRKISALLCSASLKNAYPTPNFMWCLPEDPPDFLRS